MSYVAITGEAPTTAGAIVWWRLSGDTASSRLEEEFAAAGLPEKALPSLAAPSVALSRALHDVFGRSHSANRNMIRLLDSTGRRAIVQEQRADNDLTYTIALRVGLDAKNQPTFDPVEHAANADIARRYRYELEHLSTGDIGTWLVRIVESHDGVRLRDTGGVYFVPAHTLPSLKRYVAAVHAACEHRINQVPAMSTEDAVAAVLDALSQECDAMAAMMQDALDDGDDPLTKRRARTKLEACRKQLTKIEGYRALLGAGTDTLAAKFETLADAFVARALVTE